MNYLVVASEEEGNEAMMLAKKNGEILAKEMEVVNGRMNEWIRSRIDKNKEGKQEHKLRLII